MAKTQSNLVAQMGAADDFVFPPGQHLEECSRVGGCSTGARRMVHIELVSRR